MDLQVLMFNQDDPTKCTAAKLVKFGIVQQVTKTSKKSLVLDPFSEEFILKRDGYNINSIVAIDCSWEFAQKMFHRRFDGLSRRLPPLLAGNPVNYAKIGKLTTAEALAAALYIVGLDDLANSILNKFKWGHTFYELNQELLKEYSGAQAYDEIIKISRDYGLVV
jgi:rRNA small subunit aminocarboxypropyltransferase